MPIPKITPAQARTIYEIYRKNGLKVGEMFTGRIFAAEDVTALHDLQSLVVIGLLERSQDGKQYCLKHDALAAYDLWVRQRQVRIAWFLDRMTGAVEHVSVYDPDDKMVELFSQDPDFVGFTESINVRPEVANAVAAG